MRYRPTCLAITGLAGVLTFFMAGNATAQRGGHGGGGGSHGGGGFHPSSGGVRGAPSFNRTPSFSTPRPSPQPGAGPGINRGISTAPRQFTPGPSVGNVGRTPGAVGPGPGAGRNVNNSLGFGNRNPSFGQFGGINRGNLGGNTFANSGLGRMSPRRQGLGGSNLYLANHQGWMHGYWNGNHPGNSTWNHNYPGRWGGYGPYGYGAYGPSGYGRGYGGWGYPGWGFGSGLGLGIGLGWGLGGLGYGLGGLWGLGYGGYGGWGYPGYGYGGYGGYGLGGAGLRMGYGGWGLNSWAYGPSLYNWGYASYDNPYNNASSTGVDQPIVYDYSQPINPSAAPPAETVSDQAVSLFDQARTAFKNGDYTRALDLTNQALRQLPNDPALHEFRALVLFALQRFDEVAASLYAVLSVEPGWDWTTMIGLYPDVDVYTRQLRTLEAFVAQSPQSAAARFALAYHYLTQGHTEAAIAELKVVRQMEPKDTLAAQLLQQLEQPQEPSSTTPANASSVATANPRPSIPNNSGAAPAAEDRNLTGTWTAEAGAGTTITVSFPDARRFVWKVSRQGKTQEIQGERTSGDGILTLTQDNQAAQPPLVGRVTWQDYNHFNFKLLGGDPGDPGLTFTRSA